MKNRNVEGFSDAIYNIDGWAYLLSRLLRCEYRYHSITRDDIRIPTCRAGDITWPTPETHLLVDFIAKARVIYTHDA